MGNRHVHPRVIPDHDLRHLSPVRRRLADDEQRAVPVDAADGRSGQRVGLYPHARRATGRGHPRRLHPHRRQQLDDFCRRRRGASSERRLDPVCGRASRGRQPRNAGAVSAGLPAQARGVVAGPVRIVSPPRESSSGALASAPLRNRGAAKRTIRFFISRESPMRLPRWLRRLLILLFLVTTVAGTILIRPNGRQPAPLRLPAEVHGRPGRLVTVQAETSAPQVRWHACRGPDVPDLWHSPDGKTLLFSTPAVGRYDLIAWTATGG